MMESLTLGASIIGLMVVGAMTASMIDLTIPITISGSGKMQSRFKVSLTISCLNYYRLHPLVLFLFIEKSKTFSDFRWHGNCRNSWLINWSILGGKI